MRAGGGDAQAILARQADDLAAQAGHFLARFGDVRADRGANLDHGIVHLAFDLFLETLFPFGEHLLDVGLQLTRLRIDNLKLFLDAEGEGRSCWHDGEFYPERGEGSRRMPNGVPP